MNKIYVVDQNFFRDKQLDALSNSGTNKFVIPDAAFFEMCKSIEWESTLLTSLRYLAKIPNRVFISKSIGEAIGNEITLKKPTSNIISRKYTEFVQSLLAEINLGKNGKAFDAINKGIDKFHSEIASNQLDHDTTKEKVIQLINTIKGSMNEDFVRGIKNRSRSEPELLDSIRQLLPDVLESFFDSLEMSKEARTSFIRKRPAIARATYLKIIMCCEWTIKNGYEGMRAEKFTNDIIDHEYIITATYFHNLLLSKENRSQDSLRKLHYVLNRYFINNEISNVAGHDSRASLPALK